MIKNTYRKRNVNAMHVIGETPVSNYFFFKGFCMSWAYIISSVKYFNFLIFLIFGQLTI